MSKSTSPKSLKIWEKRTNLTLVLSLSSVRKMITFQQAHTYIFQCLHSDCVHKAGCGNVQDDAVRARFAGPFFLFIAVPRKLCDVVRTCGWVWIWHGYVRFISQVHLAFMKAICSCFCHAKVHTIPVSLSFCSFRDSFYVHLGLL